MNSRQKTEYTVLYVLIVLGCGLLTAFALTRINTWRIDRSEYYLSEAKKSTSISDQLLLYEQAATLNPSEETYLGAGITALKLGDNSLAQRYLSRVKTSEGYYQLANAYYNLENYSAAIANYQKSLEIEKGVTARLGLVKSYLKIGDIDLSLIHI